jgi:hypothetical protein
LVQVEQQAQLVLQVSQEQLVPQEPLVQVNQVMMELLVLLVPQVM